MFQFVAQLVQTDMHEDSTIEAQLIPLPYRSIHLTSERFSGYVNPDIYTEVRSEKEE